MVSKYFIYIISAPTEPPLWKVGYTADLQQRLKNMRCDSPVTLELVGVIKARSKSHVRQLESQYHLQLRRAHGEWFYWSPKLQLLIEKSRPLSQVDEAFAAGNLSLPSERAKHNAFCLSGFDAEIRRAEVDRAESRAAFATSPRGRAKKNTEARRRRRLAKSEQEAAVSKIIEQLRNTSRNCEPDRKTEAA